MHQLVGKSLKIGILLAAALAGGGAASTGPSTDPAEVAAQTLARFVADNQRVVDQWKLMPPLEARPIAQVVGFKVDQGLLVADWPILKSGAVSGHMFLTDLPGQARIVCPVLPKQPTRLFPMFEYYDLTQGDGVCRHLQVINSETRLMVVQDSESITSLKSVSLIESIDQTDQMPITLRVQSLNDFKPQMNVVISAGTLDALRREHPGEYEEYLRPMFREFHQEQAVFAVEDRIAWQVLADAAQWPADLPGHVMAVVARLDANDFAQREQAQKDLHSLGEPAALFLRTVDRHKFTPEQTARIDTFLGEYFPLTDDQAEKMSSDVNFLLDCLGNDDRALRVAALNRLNRVLGKTIEYKLDQSPAERIAAIEQLRRQWAAGPGKS